MHYLLIIISLPSLSECVFSSDARQYGRQLCSFKLLGYVMMNYSFLCDVDSD